MMKFGSLEPLQKSKCERPLKFCLLEIALLGAQVYETFVTCITLGRYTAHIRGHILFSEWAYDID